MCNLDIGKPRFERKAISYRNLKSVAIYAFRDCIERFPLLTVSLEVISRSGALYHSEWSRILDCYAPPSTRVVTIRPAAPWYSNEIKIEKRQRRRLKRRWRKSRLPSDRVRFTQKCRLVNRLLWSSRTEYYSQIVNDNQSNQQKLFGVVNKLLHVTPDLMYPPHINANELANSLPTFFNEKIATIHRDLVQRCPNDSDCYQDTPVSSCCLDDFDQVTISDLWPTVRPIAKKFCDLDSLPACLLTESLDAGYNQNCQIVIGIWVCAN